MSKKGIPCHMVRWILAWLSNRLTWLTFDGVRSRTVTLKQGVSQWSVQSLLILLRIILQYTILLPYRQAHSACPFKPKWGQSNWRCRLSWQMSQSRIPNSQRQPIIPAPNHNLLTCNSPWERWREWHRKPHCCPPWWKAPDKLHLLSKPLWGSGNWDDRRTSPKRTCS